MVMNAKDQAEHGSFLGQGNVPTEVTFNPRHSGPLSQTP